MVKFNRSERNPILEPDKKNKWESAHVKDNHVIMIK